MTDSDRPPFTRIELGALAEWRNHFGGFRPTTSREGRRVVDHEVDMQYIGMTTNSFQPGEQAGYWHSHAQIEELYVFFTGRGEMGPRRRGGAGGAGHGDPGRSGCDAHVARAAGQPRTAYLGLHPRRRRSAGQDALGCHPRRVEPRAMVIVGAC